MSPPFTSSYRAPTINNIWPHFTRPLTRSFFPSIKLIVRNRRRRVITVDVACGFLHEIIFNALIVSMIRPIVSFWPNLNFFIAECCCCCIVSFFFFFCALCKINLLCGQTTIFEILCRKFKRTQTHTQTHAGQYCERAR